MHGTKNWQSEWSHNCSKNIFLRQGSDLNIIMFSKLLQELHYMSMFVIVVYTIQEFVHVFRGL